MGATGIKAGDYDGGEEGVIRGENHLNHSLNGGAENPQLIIIKTKSKG